MSSYDKPTSFCGNSRITNIFLVYYYEKFDRAMQEIKRTFTCTSLAVKVGEGIVHLIYVTWIIHNSEIMTNYM